MSRAWEELDEDEHVGHVLDAPPGVTERVRAAVGLEHKRVKHLVRVDHRLLFVEHPGFVATSTISVTFMSRHPPYRSMS
jgi:hypothetical protein